MDKLPHSLLLQILSRLDDSADVARCRVASKAFDTVFPGLRSIHLQCSLDWYNRSRSRVSNSLQIKPFKTCFIDLISKLESVESVCIGLEDQILCMCHDVEPKCDDFYLTDGDFVKEWLPRVSRSLKSLSISDHRSESPSNVLPLISEHCHNLVSLKLKWAWLSMDNLNPMPMLTNLTLEKTVLEDKHLNQLNKCFPNLQVLNLVDIEGLEDPKIHLLYLKTLHWAVFKNLSSLTLIIPNLVALRMECIMLSHFLPALQRPGALTIKSSENLKTVWLDCFYTGSVLSEFPITKAVENLTLDSVNEAPTDLKLTLGKVFKVFPNVSSLCIKPEAWAELESCLNEDVWEIVDERKLVLKTLCAYLDLDDPWLTFACVTCVLDQCVSLSEVSLLIHSRDVGTVSASFMSKCVARWPGLKWRWGTWSEEMEDSWITDGLSA